MKMTKVSSRTSACATYAWAAALSACLGLAIGPTPAAVAEETLQTVVAAPNQVLYFRVSGSVVAAVWGDGNLSLVDFKNQKRFAGVNTGTSPLPFLSDKVAVSDSVPPWVAFCTSRANKPTGYQLLQLSENGATPWDPPPRLDAGRCIAIVGNTSIWQCGVLGIESVDLATKRLKWRFSTVDAQTAQGLKFAPDGSRVAICLPDGVRGRDQSGKLLWTKALRDGRPTTGGDSCRMVPQQVVGGAVVVYNAAAKELCSIDVATGTQKWQYPAGAFRDIAAASADGSMAVINDEAGLRLIQMRTGAALALNTARKSEFYFADDDRSLVALPGVSKWDQHADGTIGVIRESDKCAVIDPATGAVRSEFALTKQEVN
jgi:outer membrane protein assembly factor BamB